MVTKGWKARTGKKWAVYMGVKELSIEVQVPEYDIGCHTVYCQYPRELSHMMEPTEGSEAVPRTP